MTSNPGNSHLSCLSFHRLDRSWKASGAAPASNEAGYEVDGAMGIKGLAQRIVTRRQVSAQEFGAGSPCPWGGMKAN